jgi:lipopolysaccharide transport system ATP-binding protein
MSDKIIKVENLGKLYRIGRRMQYATLRESINNMVSLSFRKLKNLAGPVKEERNYIWALKDISFEISKGEVVGIIGRNGSGKSTLLKVLSRITAPTEGCARVSGRVASLLEVGTGFHPELTGRDNIFLSGAILGMRKREIVSKFDEIVAFAELEKFIDTPVKYYSSGMFMRLAFAVAAHLESEIVFVDEVLAVGDISFQKKCLDKIGDVAKSGRTIFFVSHQMNQIRRLCQRCIWLDAGKMRGFGAVAETVSLYEASLSSFSAATGMRTQDKNCAARFLSWEITKPKLEKTNVIETSGPVEVTFYLEVNKPIHYGQHGLALFNNDGQMMWGVGTPINLEFEVGLHRIVYELPCLPLKPGHYYWYVTLFQGFQEWETLDNWYCFPELSIATVPMANRYYDEWSGFLNFPYNINIFKNE